MNNNSFLSNIVPYHVAKDLKKLGYPQRDTLCKDNDPTYCTQESKSSFCDLYVGQLTTYKICNLMSADSIEAPTYAQASKWLQETHGLHIFVTLESSRDISKCGYVARVIGDDLLERLKSMPEVIFPQFSGIYDAESKDTYAGVDQAFLDGICLAIKLAHNEFFARTSSGNSTLG